MTTQETLERSFRHLNRSQIENLVWHVHAGTPICCGDDAHLFSSAEGGG